MRRAIVFIAMGLMGACGRNEPPPVDVRHAAKPDQVQLKPLDPIWQQPPWNRPYGVVPAAKPVQTIIPAKRKEPTDEECGTLLSIRRKSGFEIHYHENCVKFYEVDSTGLPRLPAARVVRARGYKGMGDVIPRPTLDDVYPPQAD